MSDAVGQPMDRIDGRLKVTGGAKYAGDFVERNMAHAVIFQSEIASGKIRSFDFAAAKSVAGVIEIVTFQNAPTVHKPKPKPGGGLGESFLPFQDNKVFYNGQHIGVVVAETLEAAQQAARLVRVNYNETEPILDFQTHQDKSYVIHEMMMQKLNTSTGDLKKGFKKSDVVVRQSYTIPIENHNPMEPSATLALWENGALKVYDSTQGVSNVASMMDEVFKLEAGKTVAITKFVGGGFGCKGALWAHEIIAAMAALKTKRPVKLALTRPQMFTSVGYRAESLQKMALGATHDGQLQAIEHETVNNTAVNKDYSERCGLLTRMLYKCENLKVEHKLVKTNYQVPTFMRAPGESTGSFALESALDELAHELKMDPVALRLKNYADTDQDKKLPFSGKKLKECYALGAEKFGWHKRQMQPRGQKDGDYLVGYGMATATYPAQRFPAKARVELKHDGTAKVRSGTQDIGTGTYTIMTQIAADGLGLPVEKINFDLGDSRYPKSGVSGGSTTAASVGSAIQAACAHIQKALAEEAVRDPDSPLHGAKAESVELKEGSIRVSGNPSQSETIEHFLRRTNKVSVVGDGETEMKQDKNQKMSTHSFGAHFVEVKVHPLTGDVRVTRMVGAFACGKILNAKTARSQFMGGMIFGIGAGLTEHTKTDLRSGRLVIKDLADYHVPVNRDVPELDVIMVDDIDTAANPLGAKGIGEIGIVGVSAAIANAIFNATGVRVRELPVTPDKLVSAMRSIPV